MFLELNNATIGYNEPLIEGVQASLRLGDVCLLIGNNGVGKTTFIKSLLNQIPLIKGEIIIANKPIRNLSSKEIAHQTAVVFSKATIPSNYTVEDLISLGKYLHYPYYFNLNIKDRKEVSDIIADLKLEQYRNYNLSDLSDGNLQKAFIGRALAQNSSMIILDEPTTHLDEENKITILKLLRKLARKHQKLILFSSHDWRLAKEFADQIWLINERKLEAGVAEEVLLKHHELLNGHLFQIDEGFVAPIIIAPELEKEMLYSYLQKNFKNNLSEFKVVFSKTFWEIEKGKSHHICHSFADISKILQNAD